MASGDIQIAYTIPGSVLSAFVGGMDVAFFAGIVNRADGDFVSAPEIRRAEDLKGKRVKKDLTFSWTLEERRFLIRA